MATGNTTSLNLVCFPLLAQSNSWILQADNGQERSWRGFRGLDCPLLLIRSAETYLLSPETVVAMQDSQPGMTVGVVPGVGHAPALSEPKAQAALSAFFAW